ncbi:hypothetical protein VitviT2T_004360 [Vitis vinifera]|uniref:Amino acid transporter transmembrane domain-containing protein n=2 Tax=Vitis vinifera TaxID=29760 RepID=A0ABY9BPZ7_VITVI|nr:hypothetical protein VitviT2T_004360 [Vitis vinifera]
MVRMVNEGDDRDIEKEGCEDGLGGNEVADGNFDEDGRLRRAAVIGAGVLSLAWSFAQLGWAIGVATLLTFASITFYTSSLLAECYRSPLTGKRNYTYMQAVQATLGGKMYVACGVAQYALQIGLIIGYTIAAAISMVAIQQSHCFHRRGHEASCQFSHKPYMIGMGLFEMVVSQIPNIGKVWGLSVMASVMSFGATTLTGIEVGPGLTAAQKMWRMFRAFGDMLICCSYSAVLIEIQDTLKSSKSEIKVMKKVDMMTALIMTFFYLLCACFGYAAFGNNAHGNMLTGFGFFEPFWLIDLANIFIAMRLVGAYQVLTQPVFVAAESHIRKRWPKSKFITREYPISIGKINLNLNINFFRLTWRTMFVVIANLLALALPFFNEVLAFRGAISYWSLTVYFPVNMYIAQNKIS